MINSHPFVGTLNYYTGEESKTRHFYFIVFAKTYAQAIAKLEKDYGEIESIEITELEKDFNSIEISKEQYDLITAKGVY